MALEGDDNVTPEGDDDMMPVPTEKETKTSHLLPTRACLLYRVGWGFQRDVLISSGTGYVCMYLLTLSAGAQDELGIDLQA